MFVSSTCIQSLPLPFHLHLLHIGLSSLTQTIAVASSIISLLLQFPTPPSPQILSPPKSREFLKTQNKSLPS